ncbi:MAG TPA: hypothetical protein VK806_04655 [Bacteroidia bacterium]|nr:hypothetical protein [Bacteroidia bacterium]
MAEEGILGFVGFFSIVVAVFVLFFKLYYTIKERDLRIIVLSVFLGLVTYFVHGAMNDFLDTDKAAVPFWGFIAVLVAIDLQYGKGGSELGKEAATSVSDTPAA